MASFLIVVPLILLLILNLPIKWLKKGIAVWAVYLLSVLQIIFVLFPKLGFFSGDLIGLNKLLNIPASYDALTYTMLLSISVVVICSILICCSLFKDDDTRFNIVNVVLLSIVGMNGVVLVQDIFTMYVFLEVTAITSFILIAFTKTREGLEGAFKYLLFSVIATMMMLVSIALMLLFAGDTSFVSLAGAFKQYSGDPMLLFAIGLFISGMLIKSGLMPFHGWLPDVYSSAPNSVSVLLAGIVTKTVGIYPLIRILNTIVGIDGPIKSILLLAGALTAVIAAFAAITQTDFKRMLAYSSISQMGYIVMALGTGTVLGLGAAVFHIFNHAIFKTLLFVNSSAVESRISSRNIDSMGGLAQKMPITATTSALASLSLSGIPPLSGFWSKLLIVIALWASGNRAFAIVAVLASLITLTYMLTLQRKVFFGKPLKIFELVKEAEYSYIFAALMLTAIMLFVSFAFPFLIGSFMIPIKGI